MDEERWEAREGVASQPLPALVAPRGLHAAVVVAAPDSVLVVGGSAGDGQALNSTESLGQGASAWQAGPTFPTARKHCGACVVGSELVVVGGQTSSGAACRVVEAVHLPSGAHRTLPPLPKDTFACGVVSVQGRVVVVTGGCAGGASVDTVWALDVGEQQPKWTKLPKMLRPRAFHGAAAGDGHVFACGGVASMPLGFCERLALGGGGGGGGGGGEAQAQAQAVWEELPPLPVAASDGLFLFGCCYGGGNLFAAGGRLTYQQGQGAVFALDVREDGKQWARVAELATGREGCAAVCVGKRVLVLGGGASDYATDRCEVFHF